MAPPPSFSTFFRRFYTCQTCIIIAIVLFSVFQLKISISVEKKLSNSVGMLDALLWRPQFTTAKTDASSTTMSACLLVMDDAIKLTEWLAYHYTILPLSHLIVAIDPQSLANVDKVLQPWKSRIYMEIWRNDTWMTLSPEEGWPPGAYTNKTLIKKRIQRVKSMAHKRRQEHFAVQCMKHLKTIHPSWTLFTDTDEFVVYNYIGEHEDPTVYLRDANIYHKMTRRERNLTRPIRQSLPPLNQVTVADFLSHHHSPKRPCIKMPGLQISARESNLVDVTKHVPSQIDARMLMTLRHRKYGKKEGVHTKCMLDLERISIKAIRQEYVRTIHNPLALDKVCGKHADSFIGMDYIASIFRINHYAGTLESFEERQHDVRMGRNESFGKRNVKPVGEDDDVRPWISAFVAKVGVKEAQRLLQPLQDAYRDTNWSDVWDENGVALV